MKFPTNTGTRFFLKATANKTIFYRFYRFVIAILKEQHPGRMSSLNPSDYVVKVKRGGGVICLWGLNDVRVRGQFSIGGGGGGG